MRKTFALFLIFPNFCSLAQKPTRMLEKMGLKELQQQVNYIPVKRFTSLVFAGTDSVTNYRPRNITVDGFYMSKTEVTNQEYREFVHYVRDSIAHTMLSHIPAGTGAIDWNLPIDWTDKRLGQLLLAPGESFNGRAELDAGAILFNVEISGNRERISIYPDTLVWIRDFSNSNNEPMAKNYFSAPFYNDYPVVGISQKQAIAFCQWKTHRVNRELHPTDAAVTELQIMLPGNAEWESAASDGLDTVYVQRKKKHYLYNFGNIVDGSRITIKTYRDDGYLYASPVRSYPEGPYGLFDMKGNVSEWTSTGMEEVVNAEMKANRTRSFFVVKGGGWNSAPFYLQAGVCQFFPADEVHSYIGFRYMVRVKNKY